MKTLLLVDGSGYLYRAFHAMPDLRTSAGEPTGAIRGFVGMLRVLEAQSPAEYRACVFDAKGKTFRDDLFAQYKANRPAMPDDLSVQIAPIHEAVQALGWPVLEIPGVEADDVIGTLAEHARREGFHTVIVSADKDLAQLVGQDVELLDTMSRDGGPPRRFDRDGVIARFGVAPERIVDYLTLVGDSVDNVPGVEKVGPKTAARWLAEYGSLDGVLQHANEIGGAAGENLRKAVNWLPTARALVTVRTDADLSAHLPGLEALRSRAPDTEALRKLFERFEFRAWLRDADSTAAQAVAASEAPARPAVPAPPVHYETVLRAEQLERWIERIEAAPLASLDTETTSLDPMAARLVGISVSVAEHQACYIPVAHRYTGAPAQLALEHVLERLRPWLQSTRPKVGQNAKYDAHVFANHGVHLAGVEHDTLLQSYVLESHRGHDMDALAERHLGRRTITYEQVCGKGARQIGFEEVAIDRATEYAAEDAEVTLALHGVLWPRIREHEGLQFVYRSIEIPVSRVLFEMERTGVLIDPEQLASQSRQLGERIVALEAKAHELAGQPFNLGSPKQIGDILFGKLGLPVQKKTATGAPSTDEDVLERLAADYPLPKTLLEHRALSKLKSTYCDKLPAMVRPDTGRVHTTYGQTIAITGRLASSDPNLQNIPIRTVEGRRIREAFIAPPGSRIVSADYSQIELRIMAHLSDDTGLLEAFAKGQDVHRATAAEVFGVTVDEVTPDQRRTAKVINFGLMYGMTAFGLATNLGIGKDQARGYIERYFARYPGVARYMDATRALARRQGYVETVFGRRLWLPEINSHNGPRRQAAERAAINAPMQGTAADLIKLAMIATAEWLQRESLRTRLIMQVHDELVFEVPDAELERVRSRVPELMDNVASLKVPLAVDAGVGMNWDEAH
ncbi:MAG: DNA polymerase I [Burkholderiaceae bacterium]|nr:DNA polymerase I [Burkholderiaceae bacterium]